jgi:hypothetical protein
MVSAQSITVISPSGNPTWNGGTQQTISWQASGLSGKKIVLQYYYYDKNGDSISGQILLWILNQALC